MVYKRLFYPLLRSSLFVRYFVSFIIRISLFCSSKVSANEIISTNLERTLLSRKCSSVIYNYTCTFAIVERRRGTLVLTSALPACSSRFRSKNLSHVGPLAGVVSRCCNTCISGYLNWLCVL